MQRFDVQYVGSVCPELTASECEALLSHVRDITRSDDDIYPDLLRHTSRSLFPNIDRNPERKSISAEDMRKLNTFRLEEAIANLAAADRWLSKIRGGSDDVAIARRDIGMIAESLGGIKNGY